MMKLLVIAITFASPCLAVDCEKNMEGRNNLLNVSSASSSQGLESLSDVAFETTTKLKREELRKILSSEDIEYLCYEAGSSAKELTFKEEIELQKKTNKSLRTWTQGEISFFLECENRRTPLDKAIDGIVAGEYQLTENSKNILDEAAAYLDKKNPLGWTPLSWIEKRIERAKKGGTSTTKYEILRTKLRLRIIRYKDSQLSVQR